MRLDRFRAEPKRPANALVRTTLGDQAQDLPLARCESLERVGLSPSREELFDDGPVDDAPAPAATRSNASSSCSMRPTRSFNQVSGSVGSLVDEAHCVLGLEVLREHEHARPGVDKAFAILGTEACTRCTGAASACARAAPRRRARQSPRVSLAPVRGSRTERASSRARRGRSRSRTYERSASKAFRATSLRACARTARRPRGAWPHATIDRQLRGRDCGALQARRHG
jgi:hypothetical protein